MSNYYKRAVFENFSKKVLPNKVLILLGARRVGKTKLIQNFIEVLPNNTYLQLNGEDINDASILKERSVAHYQRLLKGVEVLIIDEAQAIPEIGAVLKLIVDSIQGIKVIATGSSMFDLSNKLGEPLVGRKNTLFLYPLAQMEFSEHENFKQTVENLEMRLLFGGYPELEQYEDWQDKKEYLFEMINSYLLKDILVFEGIKHAHKIYDLLRLIAFQVGKEVAVQELANTLQLSKNTVTNYLDLLTKVFILHKVEGYSGNLRKEISKSNRWYFYDNGIRNALINNFNRLEYRNDVGELWENYLVSERLKKQTYQRLNKQNHFWRTYDQQELDWLEITADSMQAFEFKWNSSKKVKIPTAFAKAYPEATFEVITPKIYLDFIT